MSTPLEDVRRDVTDAVVTAVTEGLECLLCKRYILDGHERALCRDIGTVFECDIGHMESSGVANWSMVRFYDAGSRDPS